ncbi:hypothetical protein LBMAG42_41870 [Deltaproteobacteria bacterium]|nr:hypothetical protein LBMAG42_41870 [Deltaproteobacteria bacterium]
MLTLLLACAEDPELLDSAEGACVRCEVTDSNQYRLEAELSAASIPLRAGHDATVEFTALTLDLQGHPIDPLLDVDQASLLAFRDLTPDEVREGLVANTLEQADVVLWLSAFPTGGIVALSEFGTMGNTLDAQQYFLTGSTWMLALQSDEGRTASSMVFLVPDAASESSAVALSNDTSHLTAEVDLEALEPVVVAADEPTLVLDWSGLKVDGFGHDFAGSDVSQMLLTRYDATPAELSSAVLDLERIAAESWTMELGGSTWANLGALRGDTAFTGISSGSTWVMMLRCETCLNPAPFLLTRLEAA